MSRSWERKVRKNMSQINKARKKQGSSGIVLGSEKKDRFTGRSFIAPILLILFIGLYVILVSSDPSFKASTMFYVTVGCYVLLALVFFFRKPYLTVGKDYVQTRKLTGDKRLNPAAIKGISVQRGYVVIEQHKGGNWVFSRVMNRYPTEEMGTRLQEFAKVHNLPFEQK
ncbi:hypothetical protein [Paenibacillus radicis (ex Gao et al. 2016)]|uniref:Methyltransferase n=1 Tax=Paenibacillus radicis (ex Gao et al. 2016) TaxID=1737354 RepID=A0A917MAF3_9BACL|nr:hypothetical protein [Paenibacillus radicis (ex Gao et al. 2016)]GGG88024.1 hypothetical protein GCM10010918_53070 [Paenibacillus radicis (ex Gao et al. 2016)]